MKSSPLLKRLALTAQACCALAGWLLPGTPCAQAAAPTLYSQPAHQSPVRADPDDLLLIPGYGFTAADRAVYALLSNTTADPVHPVLGAVPAAPTPSLGFANVVSSADVPYTLTVRLPSELTKDSSYVLWIVNSAGEWSNGVKINDARPLWITPDYAYSSATVANLARVLKVVGRNLQPAPPATTRVRLVGARTYTLPAAAGSLSLSRYVAQATLPASLDVGTYSVQVSRDGTSWVPLLGEHGTPARKLNILPDPIPAPRVQVRDFSCEAEDDTSCVVSAIAAAADTKEYPQGATVVFDARTYRLFDPGAWSPDSNSSSKHVDFEGIWVPRHVNLQGSGAGLTVVDRGTGWVTPKYAGGATVPVASLFNLQGDNTVEGFTFSDENLYTASSPGNNAALSLGIDANYARNTRLGGAGPSNVVISRNEFRLPFVAIQNRGLPIHHLFITYNVFGAFQNGLYIGRQGNDLAGNPFRLEDSVIDFNEFYPSSFVSTIAGQLGGGTRLDFSNNTADGTSTRYLYAPTDPKGFRAAFFWNLSDNSELKLIAQNRALCTGDKPGDGEAIVFDGADETAYGGFIRASPVVVASSTGKTSSTVTVSATPLRGPLSFVGQWLQIVKGPGLGQLRKITAFDGANPTTFTVSPAFDVLPREGSEVTVGLENWQSYIVDNRVDHSSPACVNGPKTAVSGGAIAFYAQTADSVMEGNRQNSTSGIMLAHQYILTPGSAAFLMLQSSNEIRNNRIEHAALFGGLRGVSGIRTAYVATPDAAAAPGPPVLDFGVTIAGNQLIDADDSDGAIEFDDGGQVGRLNSNNGCTASWEIAAVPLIFHNVLRDSRGIGISGRQPARQPTSCNRGLRDNIVWRAVLYQNSCSGVMAALLDDGTATQRVCGEQRDDSCECAR